MNADNNYIWQLETAQAPLTDFDSSKRN